MIISKKTVQDIMSEQDMTFTEVLDEIFVYYGKGGYSIEFLTIDGELLCSKCARKEFEEKCEDEFYFINSDIYYEGPTLSCDECFHPIESTYGDPWEDSE